MKKKELLDLADYLETVPEEKWNFSFVVFRRENSAVPGTMDACGTAGCALGHCAALYPNDFQLVFGLRAGKVNLCGTDCDNYAAAAKFFDITIRQAQQLFSYDGYDNRVKVVSKEMVSAQIRHFVNNEGVLP
jgi:hypothetical protein